MAQSQYDTEKIRETATAAAGVAEDIDGNLNKLSGDMNTLVEAWRGMASDSMQREFAAFDREAKAMMEKLSRLSETLKKVAAETELTESRLAALFDQW